MQTTVSKYVLFAVAVLLRTGAAVPAGPVTVEVRNPSATTRANVPLTFGQVFRRGDMPDGVSVAAAGRQVLTQVDVKRRYEDGSVRFGVISTLVPKLLAGETIALQMDKGKPAATPLKAVEAKALLETDFDAVVTLRFPDGVVRRASARKMLEQAGKDAKTWLRGPVVTEWLLAGPPVDDAGKPDEDLNVQFQIRAFAEGQMARVSVVVENCWDHWAGNIRYDVDVTIGGKSEFAKRAVDHRRLSRWRKTFWWGVPAPQIEISHDLAYMSLSGALPNYDGSLDVPPPNQYDKNLLAMDGPQWEIMGRGALTAYMPTTGGRQEIAPYPEWTVKYLRSMDPAFKKLVLAGGDLAGSWPIHVRAHATGRVMSIDDRPRFWLDPRGRDKPEWKPPRHESDPKGTRLHPDLAHQGSFAYVPYLVTGDFYYLEEAYFWAGYCLLATWGHPRQESKGILSGQIRGNAWALRNIADAAWIAADGDAEADYFNEKVRNNLADRTGRMLGPPEYNKLGFWGLRTTSDARIQNPANPNWMIVAPWEHDYLIWSLHHLVELGWPEAAGPRDFLLRWRIGMLTSAPDFDPQMAAPYRFVVGEKGADDKVVFYEDWKTLARENARLYSPGLPSGGNGYAYSARAAVVCGVDGGVPKAREALQTIESLLPDHREVMSRQPYWAVAPRDSSTK